jgi:class 3 adenylate cyclase
MAAGTATRALTGTIVFTDIVGFTEFTALKGDADALALLERQEHLVRSVMPADARIVKELGDGLLLWFSNSVGALRGTLALLCRFEEESDATGLPLWVRIGMHHGDALERGRDLVGHNVNLAARIVDLAGPGEVLLSEATKAAVGDDLPNVRFDEVGPVVMKGIPTPVRLWRAQPT